MAVKFRNVVAAGFVLRKVPKPDFPADKISEVFAGIKLPESSIELFEWIREFYPGPLGPTGLLFVPSKLAKPEPLKPIETKAEKPVKLPRLTSEQQKTISVIQKSKNTTFIVHGVSGSGKTRVYAELAKDTISAGKSAIILTPEISLTPQIAHTFRQAFPDVLVTHSGLSDSARRKIWQQIISSAKPLIIIGPRSALFAPLKNIGLVVVDEMHDNSYKQDKTPFYNAERVASALCSINQAKLILGSATPTISEYFIATRKKIPILELSKRALRPEISPSVELITVDLRDKTKEWSPYPLLSNTLLAEIKKTLRDKKQSLIYLNKRGTSKSIVCKNCGWQAKCARCDLPLTYHQDSQKFNCHTCGTSYPITTSCKICGSVDIIFKNPGTKAITSYLAKVFPDATVRRFDRDNLAGETFAALHDDVVMGQIDILVGTQILSKGHDLPNLGLAAMLAADSSLNFPDYSAEEKTFQAINQLRGRVGRGHGRGKFIIQTFDPGSKLIQTAIKGDYKSFFKDQLTERKKYGFPPYYHCLKIHAARASSASAKAAIEKILPLVRNACPKCEILGPAPSWHFKRAGKFHWQIIVKSKNRAGLTAVIAKLPPNCIANIDPVNLL